MFNFLSHKKIFLGFRTKLMFAVLCVFSGIVHAAQPQPYTGKIDTIGVGPGLGNKAFLRVVGHSVSAPYTTACSANSSYWTYAFDISSDAGKALYSLLLSAHTANRNVAIYGLGTCTVHGSIQDVEHGKFAP
ncbi:MAG: hypothetical protein HPY82_22350 [Gammaproteobacteria bacterium]|nr:hypothetical protein [Gammaproteobacteria bacterium]